MNPVFSEAFNRLTYEPVGLLYTGETPGLSRTGYLLKMAENVIKIHDFSTNDELFDISRDFLVCIMGYAVKSGLSLEECESIFKVIVKTKGVAIGPIVLELLGVVGELADSEMMLLHLSVPEFRRKVHGLLNRAVTLVAVLLELIDKNVAPYELVCDALNSEQVTA